jgi:hypothetical protein
MESLENKPNKNTEFTNSIPTPPPPIPLLQNQESKNDEKQAPPNESAVMNALV